MTALRGIVFDVDGTLVDSQGQIHAAMTAALAEVGRPAPGRAAVRDIVGLSLDRAVARLLSAEATEADVRRAVAAYKEAYVDLRRVGGAEAAPLYPGVRAMLDRLAARDDVLLAVATGKSRRGLDHLFEMHDLGGYFAVSEVADLHPSKPHPAMLRAAVDGLGLSPAAAVMVGDTTYDMDMAVAAGVRAHGVGWGYHDRARLHAAGAVSVADDVAALEAALEVRDG